MSRQQIMRNQANPHHDLRGNKSAIRNALRNYLALGLIVLTGSAAAAQAPPTGAKAPDFTLATPVGTSVSLSSETAKATTILVLLRGYPGYQCPYCVKQVHDFAVHSSDFAAKKAQVLLVYPGPPAELDQRAKEFLAKQADLPSNVKLIIDPDYKMTNLYHLRWDAPHETAYPATFIVNTHGDILYEKISHTHGDRTTADEILSHLTTN